MNRTLDVFAVLVLAGIFGYAGFVKALEPQAFAGDIHAFRILPRWAVGPLAIMLPFVECVTACVLLLPALRKSAALVLLGLLLAFICAGIAVMWRGIEVQCDTLASPPGFSDVGCPPTASVCNAWDRGRTPMSLLMGERG